MKQKEAILKTAEIIQKLGGLDKELSYRIAERIYADVTAVQVDEEINRWFMFVYSDNVLHS